MPLYQSPLTVTLWPSSFLKKYGPMIPPAHKAHQTVSFSGYPDAPNPQDPSLASYRNWVVEDIPGDKFYKGYTVSSFAPPNPPNGSVASGIKPRPSALESDALRSIALILTTNDVVILEMSITRL
ncbi:hypothetical protein TNCV_897561 [Trichonephila clavipes]|nr:hypothetical protein TNCV_897561 [Trichonephila clavipes]